MTIWFYSRFEAGGLVASSDLATIPPLRPANGASLRSGQPESLGFAEMGSSSMRPD